MENKIEAGNYTNESNKMDIDKNDQNTDVQLELPIIEKSQELQQFLALYYHFL